MGWLAGAGHPPRTGQRRQRQALKMTGSGREGQESPGSTQSVPSPSWPAGGCALPPGEQWVSGCARRLCSLPQPAATKDHSRGASTIEIHHLTGLEAAKPRPRAYPKAERENPFHALFLAFDSLLAIFGVPRG